ncbi:MAG: hypothetical protein PUH87_08720, partial [Bacteroidales bacterium]|nr:hypothetical protein [Bacteroidales bacterium]MDY5448928.1 hypothetical protein [Prevotella sp.]
KFGNIEAVIVAPGSATEFKFEGSMTVYADHGVRIAAIAADGAGNDGQALDERIIRERIMKAWSVVCRDFLVSSPRVALVFSDATTSLASADMLTTIVDSMQTEGIGIFGPYREEEYIKQSMSQHFDLTLAMTDTMAKEMADILTDDTRAIYLAGLPMLMAMTDYPATYQFEEDDLDDPAHALRAAIYTAMEVRRNRKAYDEAHESPLPKLYHERKDDSEKVRFAVSKRKEQQDGANA